MELFHIYLTFVKIGALAFGGGYAVLPLITRYVVEENAWLTMKELLDLVALSQITPGPIAINAATFIGTKVAGIPGAVIATLGNVTPQFILMMLLSYVMFGGRKIHFLNKILKGLKPAIVALIGMATLFMIQTSLFHDGVLSWSSFNVLGLVGFVVGLSLYLLKKMDIIKLIILGAGIGVLLHGIGLLFL